MPLKFKSNRYVTVHWSSKNSNLTCGWLISEVLRKLMDEEDFNKKTYITGMKNLNPKTSEVYDYLLTQLESSLAFIKGTDSLQIISKKLEVNDECAAQPERFMIGSVTSANSAFSPIFSDNEKPHGM